MDGTRRPVAVMIGYYIHGRGRGHASRAVPIAKALREAGYQVMTYAGGHATDLLGDSKTHRRIDPVLPGWTGVRAFPGRILGDLIELRRLRPSVVISDGDMASLIAARSLFIPTITLGHDLVFTRCCLPASLPPERLRAERRSAFFASRLGSYGVAVHFLPIQPRVSNTRVARPFYPEFTPSDLEPGDFLVGYFRDQNGHQALTYAAQCGARVVSFGDQNLDIPGVEARPFDRIAFSRALRAGAGVIASAGSNLLAECVLLGKPMLALYRQDDHEQALNALLASQANVAQSSSLNDLTGKQVRRFIERVRTGDFDRVDLKNTLPDTVEVMLSIVADLVT